MGDEPASYLLTNAELETAERFAGLEAVFDPVTRGHLTRLGLTEGMRCLEVGAGSGSIARWMADEVGPDGRVLAVDLDPRWCRPEGRVHLEVRAVDLLTQSVPAGPWDVIHERLVLQHIPTRLDVLAGLVEALAPGGVLLLEDFDTGEVRTVDRAGPSHDLIARVAQAFNDVLRTRGGVSDFAANALRTLDAHGLEGTGASGYVAVDHGGTGWATVQAANAHQVRADLIDHGLGSEEIDRFLEAMADPDTIVGSSVMISTWGRRPLAAAGDGARP
ncbi:MAG: class I SAM-dependent methyltransferase [Actinoallomurus sp.]